jgi:hypothetical protein
VGTTALCKSTSHIPDVTGQGEGGESTLHASNSMMLCDYAQAPTHSDSPGPIGGAPPPLPPPPLLSGAAIVNPSPEACYITK